MTQRQLQVGDYLLLRPEDVGGTTTRAFYASVVNVARSMVTVVSVLSGQEDSGFELACRLEELRVVPRSEATGLKPGEWLRQAVWVSAGSSYRFGQARGYSGSKLEIWTTQGVMSVTRRQLVSEVHPLISIALGFQDWPKRAWPKPRLQALHANLMAKLEDMGRPNRGIPTVQEWLDELAPLADIAQLARAQVEWIDPASGLSQLCSLQHAFLFVVYREMRGQPPSGLIERLGKTLTEEPGNFRAWIDRVEEQGGNGAEHQTAITAQAFVASLSDDDASEAGDVRTDEQERSETTQALPARSAQHAAGNRVSTTMTQRSWKLLEFLRDHRPHLLQTYMRRSVTQTVPLLRRRYGSDLQQSTSIPPQQSGTRRHFAQQLTKKESTK
ncbi:hypothetical protein PF008_g6030 [Phytophthora fragariae]|uniref:Uncharacterized protein n=1 Tax=Phytophthora fragariae TaxID=53985 RepID=A0A6G0S8A7_9STRA|nr:hypothetical protein PF008_g6030 [Phytophthora fragariae]